MMSSIKIAGRNRVFPPLRIESKPLDDLRFRKIFNLGITKIFPERSYQN